MTALSAEYRVIPAFLRIADAVSPPLSEAELSRIWAAQSFPAEALSLADRRPLRVILPGRPGGGAGPDYRDAIVSIDGTERRGDIELHVRASSYRAHGHHLDPAYDNVVLHVVFEADDGESTTLCSGSVVPVAQFAPWVGQRTDELEHWLQAQPLWQEPCSGATARLGLEGTREVLAGLGERRFETRMARLREAIDEVGEQQAVWLSLLDIVGHGSERPAWRRLGELVPAAWLAELLQADMVLPVLMAAAGLANGRPGTLINGQGADALPEQYRVRPLSPPLKGGSRPASRPERRLRAVASLVDRAGGDFAALARSSVAGAKTLRGLAGRWVVTDPLGGPALLGESTAREILLNVVLPLTALDPNLSSEARRFVRALPPAPSYGRTAFLEAALRRGEAGFRVKSALQQQGLLALTADWCRQGGCGRCPLSG